MARSLSKEVIYRHSLWFATRMSGGFAKKCFTVAEEIKDGKTAEENAKKGKYLPKQ
ncbi:MAG: hypothetical protein H7257_03025 [Taibaiella sp.]|nr:hypothetical protein [Taibaiella sp.]